MIVRRYFRSIADPDSCMTKTKNGMGYPIINIMTWPNIVHDPILYMTNGPSVSMNPSNFTEYWYSSGRDRISLGRYWDGRWREERTGKRSHIGFCCMICVDGTNADRFLTTSNKPFVIHFPSVWNARGSETLWIMLWICRPVESLTTEADKLYFSNIKQETDREPTTRKSTEPLSAQNR